MRYTPLIGADMSGRMGAIIASRNRYGGYFREGAIPVNPSTTRQGDVRTAFQYLTGYWESGLNAGQRASWNEYAAVVPITGNNGKSQIITGFNMFVRSNVARVVAGLAIVDPGPAELSLPEVDTALSVSISAATQNISVTFNNALAWANEVGGHLLVHCGTPQKATRDFFKGPYRYAGKVVGDAAPPASPATIAGAFTYLAGQKVWVQCRVSRADGRLSEFFRATCTVGA
jgi:hypothetical protein